MKFKKGEILTFNNPSIIYSANRWARAIFTGKVEVDEDGGELIKVEWIRDGNENGQHDGWYYSSMFLTQEEVNSSADMEAQDWNTFGSDKI
jgi:hypothetical protein